MMGRVLQHHAEIFEMEGIAQRAFHADIGGNTDKDEVADAAGAQHAVHIGVEEAGIARLRTSMSPGCGCSSSTIA